VFTGRTAVATLAVAVLVTVAPASPALADPDLGDLDRQITAASERLEVLVEQHNAMRADLAATQARAADTAARLAADSTRLEQMRAEAGHVAAWAYRTGLAAETSALLSAGSPRAMLDQLTALETLGYNARIRITGLGDVLDGLKRDQDSLVQLRATQEQQARTLADLTEQVRRDLGGLRQLRSRTVAATASASAPPRLSVPGAAGAAVAYAYAQLGKPYVFGTAGPNTFDCSGLTMAAWRAAGVSLPHNAARQYNSIPHVARSDLVPGDLVFYYSDIHHVAIYVGNGMVIHAPNSTETVRAQGIDLAPIYGYGRP
jgi:peptidoglycan DL-endopeptidase CwlO